MKRDIRKGYAEQRRRAYPSVGDQLDAYWKGGAEAEAMRRQVAAVKARFPKAENPHTTKDKDGR